MGTIDANKVNELMCDVLCEELKADKTIELYLNAFADFVKPSGWPELDNAYKLPYKIVAESGEAGNAKLNESFKEVTENAFGGFDTTRMTKITDFERTIVGTKHYSPYMLWRYLEIKFGSGVDIVDGMKTAAIIAETESLAKEMIDRIKALRPAPTGAAAQPAPPGAAGAAAAPQAAAPQAATARTAGQLVQIAKYINFIKLITEIISEFLRQTRMSGTDSDGAGQALSAKYKNAHNVLIELGKNNAGDINLATLETHIQNTSIINMLKALKDMELGASQNGARAKMGDDGVIGVALTAAPADDAAAEAALEGMLLENDALKAGIGPALTAINASAPTAADQVNIGATAPPQLFPQGLFTPALPLVADAANYDKATKRFADAAGGGGGGSKSDSRSRKNRSRSRRR